MAEQNEKKTKHLRSARQWLTRAEESFDKDRDIRGELNLFLAQAELQHVQETGRNQGWLKKYPVLLHGLAAVVAVTLAWAVYGAYNQPPSAAQPAASPLLSQPGSQRVPGDGNPIFLQPPAVAPVPAAVSAPVAAPAPAEPSAVRAVVPVKRQADGKKPEPVAVSEPIERSPVSSDEMKNLIRAAGKSLRGE